MFLLVGLGNPGKKYNETRHNIGFMFLDYLADHYQINLKESKWQAKVSKSNMWDQQIILAKPETYMNLSGQAVGQIADYYKITPENIVIVHDDIDLAFGRIKIVVGRGAGGHNGIRSIISHLGTKDFIRIKVGVGRPEHSNKAADHVLSRFSKTEIDTIQSNMSCIEDAFREIVENGPVLAMNKYNSQEKNLEL